jgi:caa(3)-type oxidase subunit IV
MADTHTHAPESKGDHRHAVDAHSHASDAHGHGGSYLRHIRPYLLVGAALFVFTVITVGLSYVDFDQIFSSHGMNMKVGLAVATFKVCLVGAWFMHLKSEKRNIWIPLLFTFFFCLGLFVLCLLAYFNPIMTTGHTLH